MKSFILNIIFIVMVCFAAGQNGNYAANELLDSLKNELNVADDTSKIYLLIHIAESFEYSNSDSTFYYGEKALELAKKFNNVPAQMGAMSFMGYALLRQGNLPRALEISLEAIQLGKELPVRIAGGIGPVYSVLGELYLEIGDFEKAKQYFQQMTALGEKDIVGVAYGQYYQAMIYEKLNKLDSTDFYLKESYETFGSLNYSYYPDVYHVYPPWYNLRAKLYLKQDKPDQALIDLHTSLQMTIRNGDIFHVTNTCIDLSNYHQELNLPDSALIYAELAMQEANKIYYKQGILMASEILAKLYETADPVKALQYYKRAQETRSTLYGAGNIQVMREMIAQEEKKQAELADQEAAYRNRLRMNTILGLTFTFFVIAVFLVVIIRRKQKAKQNIESAYNQLKATQEQLIHSEKMASLGELTAGIAHEIQNPLNFVNNFSEVNLELSSELRDELKKGDVNEVDAIVVDIIQNEQKINFHGKRADTIVKGMLQHSRTSSGLKELTDINALTDEYLRLAYHGLRAKDKSFNADFKLHAAESLPKINVVGQDIGRVLLNLINNAFYSVLEKTKQIGIDFKPEVLVATNKKENQIKISIKDNGNGIPDEIKDKIFQPFFTTKPTGQGTGLGLSMSYDIVTKGHGGDIKVESMVGVGSEFIILLPIEAK